MCVCVCVRVCMLQVATCLLCSSRPSIIPLRPHTYSPLAPSAGHSDSPRRWGALRRSVQYNACRAFAVTIISLWRYALTEISPAWLTHAGWLTKTKKVWVFFSFVSLLKVFFSSFIFLFCCRGYIFFRFRFFFFLPPRRRFPDMLPVKKNTVMERAACCGAGETHYQRRRRLHTCVSHMVWSSPTVHTGDSC